MTTKTYKTVFLLTGILLVLCLISGGYLLYRQHYPKDGYTAYIYIDGDLYQSIPLAQITEGYQFDILSENGGYNTVHVEHDSICISQANCPDQICVKQGTIQNDLLPITCLPHRLVIELKPSSEGSRAITPDMITH